MKRVFQSISIATLTLAFQLPALAKCPVSDNTMLVVKAPIGNLQVDTTGRDTIEVVAGNDIVIKEICGKDRVEYSAESPTQIRGTIDGKIVVPRTVSVDLITFGGSIRMTDSDASATLRTTGGPVSVGNIKGKTTIVTQGGFIKAGNIGGDAELRISSAGSIEVGNIAGNADLHTAGGAITAGSINGKVIADASGGAIHIKAARGDALLSADPGDIFIGEAARIDAKTTGGSITNSRVRGHVKGISDSGNIRLESAGSWVEATTGSGSIYVRMNPENFDGDLHVALQTGVGDIALHVPEQLKATFDAMIDRPALNGRRIVSDIPLNGIITAQTIAPTRTSPQRGVGLPGMINRFGTPDRQQGTLNGGGNPIKLHTSLGKIEIFKIKL